MNYVGKIQEQRFGWRVTEADILEDGDGADDNRENCSDKLSSSQ